MTVRFGDVKDNFGSGGANIPPSGSGTPSMRDVVRQVLGSIASAFADQTAMEAGLARDRVDGQVAMKVDDLSLWAWSASSSASADSTHIQPTDATGNGRWVIIGEAGTLGVTSAAPEDVTDGVASAGSDPDAARADHAHHIADSSTSTKGIIQLDSATPVKVGAAGVAGSGGLASDSAHVHADPNRAVKGTNLTDTATQTIATPGTGWRVLPTLSQGGALTVGVTGAVAGDQLDIVRTDTSANAYAIINGGGGAGTLITLPVSKQMCVKLQFDGTNWALRFFGGPF
jgi:hypothetical protein